MERTLRDIFDKNSTPHHAADRDSYFTPAPQDYEDDLDLLDDDDIDLDLLDDDLILDEDDAPLSDQDMHGEQPSHTVSEQLEEGSDAPLIEEGHLLLSVRHLNKVFKDHFLTFKRVSFR